MSATQLADRHGVDYAAQFLGISRDSVYRWVSEGRLSHLRIGKFIRFTDRHLAEALESAERPARSVEAA